MPNTSLERTRGRQGAKSRQPSARRSAQPLADMGAIRVRGSSAVAACVVSAATAVYAGFVFSRGRFLSEDLSNLHQTLLCLLLATWFVADSVVHRRSSPSFDHGWFFLLALPIYGPYHLVSTRRWRGVAICGGMIALFILPWLAEVVVYCVS